MRGPGATLRGRNGARADLDWLNAYRGKRVLLTGHTGFKGGWLAIWLRELGANVLGFALPPATVPSLFESAGLQSRLEHVIGDIRERENLERVWQRFQPEVVFHLAAQALVRRGYQEPLLTVETNVLGTAHVLDVAREFRSTRALVMVTSDKCYENHEWDRGYHERDELGGRDVYSASKASAEILIRSYRESFFHVDREAGGTALASGRAGNVIGGGDWSLDRIVPDAIRAVSAGAVIDVRNPNAVRPWQHVLEPLSGYLLLGAHLLSDDAAVRKTASQAWNFGPTVANTRTVAQLVDTLVNRWGAGQWKDVSNGAAPHEAGLLRLDISKAESELGWRPRWNFETAIEKTVDWYRLVSRGADPADLCLSQIAEYVSQRPH